MEFRLLLWFLVGWQQLYGCYGCLDEERSAFIDIKLSFDLPGYASRFDSWLRDGSDCCSWKRVSCGSVTGRVQRLDLDFAWSGIQSYTLNATLFIPLQELRSLNLSDNNMIGYVPNGGFDRLSNLSKLEFLDLSGNLDLNDSILPSLTELTSLKALSLNANNMGSDLPVHGLVAWSKLSKLQYLDLSFNQFNETVIPSLVGISSLKTLLLSYNGISGRLPIRELSKLSHLEYLDLSENEFNETVIPSLVGLSTLKTLLLSHNDMSGRLPIRELSKLSRLEVLDLSGNRFLGMFPTLQEEWTSLKALSLSSNQLNDTLPIQGLCRIRNLQELDLSDNQLIGVLPSCLGNLTSLRFFDVSNNHLQVNFPSHLISNLTSLEYLSLSNNKIEGILLFNSLSNHSKLKILELVDQYNKLEVETESLVVAPSFQLEGVILSNCNLNKDSGDIPSFLSTQYALQWIDLSVNNLKGHIPNWFLENKTSLYYLNLHSNSLSGPLILPSQLNNSVYWLDLSKNEFSGQVPTNMGIIFSNLVHLNLSRNSFHGSIPSSFGYMTGLSTLDLSDNSLSGKITENQLSYWPSLDSLYLSNNNLHGRVSAYSNLSTTDLFLDGNQFSGEIPSSICNNSGLSNLDISGNQLSGRLPNCMGSLGQLASLNAEGNHLEGHIPNEFCNFEIIEFLDLSSNHLSGSIPPCFNNLSSLQYLHLHDNGLTGPFPMALSDSPDIITIDLRNNHLSGKLPSWIGGSSLESLRVLLLGGNHLEGSIPNQMCLLKHLRILDLSHNNISGRIPLCFKNMGFQGGDFVPFHYAVSPNDGDYRNLFPYYKGLLQQNLIDDYVYRADEEEFLTKRRPYSYKGDILNLMSGIDLSCNQLAGEIPLEIGSMRWLRALNLSNNQLTGPIPRTLSNLKELESLDLSHNMLTGPLPRELTEMNALAVFSVAYNNLSGPTLGRDGQFITFEESSYQGNPDLCGPPLGKNCTASPPALPSPLPDEDDDAIDRLIFFASFALAFVMGFWGYMAVLYFKDEWRYAVFRAADRYTEAGFTNICGLLARIKAFW